MEFSTITEKQTRTLTMKEGSGDCFGKTVLESREMLEERGGGKTERQWI